MKILFVAPLDKEAGIHNWGAPSLALIRITSYLEANLKGVKCFIYDQQIDDYDIHERYLNKKIDIIGISILHYTLLETLKFIHIWKKDHPESLIVIGGNEAAANYQEIFDKSPADIIVLAEGEDTMLDIIRWKRGQIGLDEINGIIYRKYAKELTEEKLWDYWKDVDFSKYRYKEYWKQIADLYEDPDYERINYVRISTSSHCNQKCTFCSLSFVRNNATGRKTKPVSLKGWQIMEIVDNIHNQLPETRTLYFCSDNVFYPNKKYFYDFAELYKKSGYDYRILIQTASYSLSEKEFKMLKEIGCQHITIGVENASERIRSSLCKRQSSEKIEQIIEWSKKYEIPVYYLIILIPPESTIEDLRINYETINRWIKKGVQISIEPLIYAYRGTPIFEDDRYEISYKRKKIEGTGIWLKDSIYVLPKDPIVRELSLEFKRRERDYVERAYSKLPHKHKYKGQTAYILLELLGELIKEFE